MGDCMEELNNIINDIFNEKVIKIVVSNKIKSDNKYNKVVVNLLSNSKKEYYQVEKYTDKQVFHENIELNRIQNKIKDIVFNNYKQVNIWTDSFDYDIKISKKGKIHVSKKKSKNILKANSHNKQKNYILKEGMIIEPLIDLGIFTKEGKIINSKYDKYKQINRFIELIDDEIKKKNYKELTILDFGCGKSYLTFVLYYYFTKIKNIDVKMIGLDLKEDVIKKCNEIAKRYNYDNLTFELGDINGYKYENKVDMVITLHACDTATDYALYNAIKWNVNMIFSVPCCQHEINQDMHSEKLSILNRYGIIQERVSALMTDAIRANLLESVGYKTQLLEFIDIAHSPKNILIRANKSNISKEKREKSLMEVENIINEFNTNQTLYQLLKKDGRL